MGSGTRTARISGRATLRKWLHGLAPALAECGVALHVATVDSCTLGSPGYAVAVNGKALELYRFDPADPRSPATEDPWMDCSLLPAAEVNRLLATAGSDRRLALIWPGSQDGIAVLSPEDTLRAAAASVELDEDGLGFVIP